MEEKIREEIRKIERRMEWKRESLNKAVEKFKESAASYDADNITTFLPGKIEEIVRYGSMSILWTKKVESLCGFF